MKLFGEIKLYYTSNNQKGFEKRTTYFKNWIMSGIIFMKNIRFNNGRSRLMNSFFMKKSKTNQTSMPRYFDKSPKYF